MNLQQLQKQFAAQIYNQKEDQIISKITACNADIKDRISVYRNNIFGNFNSVLEMVYPAIKDLVGDNYFANLCIKYRENYPSTSGNLDEYGKYFSLLIGKLKNEHKLLYLKDLARLEWKYNLAYFAKDVADFDLEKFRKLKEKDLFKVKFKLHPSCYLLASNHPIFSIWQFATSTKKGKLDLEKLKKEFILVERSRLKTNIHRLSEPELLFLQSVKKKQNLYEIYQNISQKIFDFDIGLTMNKFISNGVIIDFDHK